MSKLDEFTRRSRYRNPHLYAETAVAGYDYVMCPVSNCRMSMIKTNYITNVLGMSVESYNEQYPNIQKICKKRTDNISNGLQQIDQATGKTKYQLSQEKSKQTLLQIGSDGLSGYSRKGQKTRATHMSNIDEMGRNGYRRQADARLTTILPNGMTVEQNAHIKQKQVLLDKGISRVVGASLISKINLKPILDFLTAHGIKYYFDKTEYAILDETNGKYYFYDLTIPEKNIIVEYQSSAWHANPEWDDEEWNSWRPPKGSVKTPEDALAYDYAKARAAFRQRGFNTYYVWESSLNTDVERIICLLKMQNMK